MIEARKKKITKDFGNTLKKFRKSKKMSLRELSSETGIEHSHIARMEYGEVNPTLTTIVILAEALGADPRDLIGK